MRFWVRVALASTALAGISSAAQAAREPVVLAPSSQWNVDFAPTSCRLARTFGEGENLHVLFVEQHYPSAHAGLTVGGPSFRRFSGQRDTMLGFSDEIEPRETNPFKGSLDSIGDALIYSNVGFFPFVDNYDPGDEAESARPLQLDTSFGEGIRYVSLRQRSREVRFETGPLGEAFAILNTCTQDMIRDWGLDVETHMSATRMPRWTNRDSVARLIQRTYPSGSQRRGQQAIIRMRVIVNEEGRVEQCKVDAATDNDLDSPACSAMSGAEFEPALDAQGNPFRSYYATSIIYRLS